MSVYPEDIEHCVASPCFAGICREPGGVGSAASFTCGSFVRFYIQIDPHTKVITAIRYQSNGCGFAIAVGEQTSERLEGRAITELAGLLKRDLLPLVEAGKDLGLRGHCSEMVIEALRAAFADLRNRTIAEFVGEKALICTCFGISEEEIQHLIKTKRAGTMKDVAKICNAGSGCGSCQFLIQEMLDSRASF